MTTIGIDVGSKTLVVSVLHKNIIQLNKRFANTIPGCKKIAKLCKKYTKYGKVCVAMEATGAYYLDAAITLSYIKNVDLIVANARATKAFSAAKNDPYVKKYVEHLLENRNLSRLQAIVAVMRKLLHAIHGMLLKQKPFDNTRFFDEKRVA